LTDDGDEQTHLLDESDNQAQDLKAAGDRPSTTATNSNLIWGYPSSGSCIDVLAWPMQNSDAHAFAATRPTVA
jgi:hypothetical protein